MRSQSKLKLIIFAGAVFIFVEYFDNIYNFGDKERHEKTCRRQKEMVSVSKEDFQRVTDDNSTFVYSAYVEERDKVGHEKTCRRQKEMVSVSKEDFQRVTDDNSTFVYSAYVEERTERLRVIGFTNKRNNTHIYFILRYKLHETSRLVKGYVNHIPESHGKIYKASFFLCDLTNVTAPDEVSVVDKPAESVRNVLPVRRILQQHNKHVFTACVSPLYARFNDTAMVQESIELNKLLGVEKFIIYIYNVSKDVLPVFNYYENKGIVTLMPWTLPGTLEVGDHPHRLLHFYGQLAALNDCLYRSKGKSKFISSTDMDEFIIPQKQSDVTWSDMLSRLPSHNVYIIRSSFFSQAKNCSRMKHCKTKLTIDSYKLRDNIILGPHLRSKFIAKTDEVTTMGIHFPWALRNGTEYTVSPDVALLHHYRRHSTIYTKEALIKIIHLAATKYIRNLRKNVIKMQIEVLSCSNKTEI